MRAFTSIVLWLTAIALLFSIPVRSAFAQHYSTIALSGRQADETPPGTTFSNFIAPSDFCRPRIDDAGNVIFEASLAGPGVDTANNRGIWTGRGNSLQLLARAGDVPPGVEGGAVYFGFNCNPVINGNGNAAFLASLTGPGITTSNDLGIWSAYGHQVYLLVREDSPLPGVDPAIGHGPGYLPVISSSGTVAFAVQVTSHDDVGLWKGTPGSLDLIARSDLTYVGYNTPLFRIIDAPTINSSGDAIFSAVTPSYSGIWKKSGNATELVVRTYSQAPQMPPGLLLRDFLQPRFSDAGVIAFTGSVYQEGVFGSKTAIWAGPPDSLQLVAHEGSHAPDAPSDVNLGHVYYVPVLNKRGDIAFRGFLDGGGFSGGDMGLWTGPYANPKLLLTSQTVATTTPRGEIYFKFFIADPTLNNDGDVAFYALLQGPGVNTANDHSLWVRSHEGDLIFIARQGSPFDVGGGDMRTIKEFGDYTMGGADPTLGDSYFNDAGQLVFELSFTDGSAGIFVATIPEPVSFAPMFFLGWLFRRRMPK
jgi:hypothetical protein